MFAEQKMFLYVILLLPENIKRNKESYKILAISYTMRALSKADLKPSRANMHGAASLWKEKQTLSLPPTCTQLVLCEKGKFSLDGSFSKNAPYKQKIIFHLTSIGKMSRKIFFLPWTVGRWYSLIFFQ